ncbi:MAG: helix-turn-helix domain-containing protein, partial [Candidatus Paceibacterota bacterium]
ARGGKISAQRISGIWYVSEDEFSGSSSVHLNKKEGHIDSLSKRIRDEKANEVATSNESYAVTSSEKNKTKITLEGIDYISSKRAAKIMGYTQDYIGQLCRAGKIESRQIGRSWYIPESVVKKDIQGKSREAKVNETEVSLKEESLSNILEFKKDTDTETNKSPADEPASSVELNVVQKPQEKNEIPVATEIEEEKSSVMDAGYVYPSFLSAEYSVDSAPLMPAPKRTYNPVLHEIVSNSRDNKDENTVSLNRPVRPTTSRNLQQVLQKRVSRAIIESKEESLALRPPVSLIKLTSVATGVVLVASLFTFIPQKTVFNSFTGTLETISLFAQISANATAIDSVDGSSFIESFAVYASSFFEDTIEYKAK